MIETRAGVFSGRTGSPGACGTGSHTNVILVLPSAPRSDPSHVRTTRAREGVVMAAIALSIAFGGSFFVGANARAASSAVNAQYPLRARTWMPGRFTLTLISWNLPSVAVNVEL